jgi:hypothetical protein
MKKKIQKNIGKIFTVLTILSTMVLFGQLVAGIGIVILSL